MHLIGSARAAGLSDMALEAMGKLDAITDHNESLNSLALPLAPLGLFQLLRLMYDRERRLRGCKSASEL